MSISDFTDMTSHIGLGRFIETLFLTETEVHNYFIPQPYDYQFEVSNSTSIEGYKSQTCKATIFTTVDFGDIITTVAFCMGDIYR